MIASSPRLALVHGHCGWVNISRVGSPSLRLTGALAGQLRGGAAGLPGVVEYFHKTLIPKATAGIQSATAKVITACFFNPRRNDIRTASRRKSAKTQEILG